MLVTQIPQAGSGSSSLPGQALVGRGSELLRCAAQWSLRDVLQTDVVAERQAYSLMMPAIQRTSAWLMLAMHHSLWLMSLPWWYVKQEISKKKCLGCSMLHPHQPHLSISHLQRPPKMNHLATGEANGTWHHCIDLESGWILKGQGLWGALGDTGRPRQSRPPWQDGLVRAIAHWIGKHGSLQLRVLKSAVGIDASRRISQILQHIFSHSKMIPDLLSSDQSTCIRLQPFHEDELDAGLHIPFGCIWDRYVLQQSSTHLDPRLLNFVLSVTSLAGFPDAEAHEAVGGMIKGVIPIT